MEKSHKLGGSHTAFMVRIKGSLVGLQEADVWMRPQDALEPGLSGSIPAELSLDYGISKLRFHAGPFFSA